MQQRSSGLISRRDFLFQALSSGALVGGVGWHAQANAAWFGSRPKPLPKGQSIFELDGKVLVNGRTARRDMLIRANDRIETAPGGKIVFAVGQNAYILRERSLLEMQGKELLTRGLRLITGAMLGVFGKREDELRLHARNATIGIRGTALYSEIFESRSYFCTCYGETRIQALADPAQSETIISRYHDAPRWVAGQDGHSRSLIQAAPMFNHDDLELIMLEALVGREVPFAEPLSPIDDFGGSSY